MNTGHAFCGEGLMTPLRFTLGCILLLALAALVPGASGTAAAAGTKLPDAAHDDPASPKRDIRTIVLAGGCFWGVEEVFQHVRGVTDAVSGYSGGAAKTAVYELVSTGTTGHAESVKVSYDASKITLGQILKVFFSVVLDPTEVDRQGPDVGPQYRSAVFFADEHQQQVARAYIDQLNAAHVFRRPVATQVVPLTAFYVAEAYHQDFAEKNPNHRYIVLVDQPKVAALHLTFPALYR
jgi:peptide-methionine (S)-S-oxide reductase